MRWIRYGVAGLLGLIVVLAAAGALYQFIGTNVDQQKFPPPGKLIDVGGYRLHLYCTGAGSPTVVMEAMSGGWSVYWSTVQPEIAKMTRICSYDRAGYAWSDPGPTPRTGQQIATELHTLLVKAGVDGPYVLVGHSFGGFCVRLFRNLYPSEVAGMVLVDAGYEAELSRAQFRKFFDAGRRQLSVLRVVTPLGILRLFSSLGLLPPYLAKQSQQVPPDVRPMLRAGRLRTPYITAVANETAVLPETLEQVRTTSTLGDLPLVILTATGPIWWPDLPAEVDAAQFKQEWLEMQQKLTTLSSHSTQLFADKSSHFMQFDQPQVIVDGVRRVVEATRQKSQ
jgi:pimeloyl-ACP methyl ester carboxylesterase